MLQKTARYLLLRDTATVCDPFESFEQLASASNWCPTGHAT